MKKQTNKTMERLVNQLNRTSPEILLSRNGQDGQTNLVVRNLVRKTVEDINFDNISSRMPQLSPDEIAGRSIKDILQPLKKIDPLNKFGGIWNQKMAEMAAEDLGIPTRNLHRLITQNGETGKKLRTRQGEIAKETEALLRRNLLQNPPDKTKSIIQLETWIGVLAEDIRKELEKSEPDLSKEEKGKITEDVAWAFIRILNFAPKQDVPLNELRDKLIAGRLGKAINLVALHCLRFKNSLENGIVVNPSAEDFIATNNDGSKILLTQHDSLDKISEFADILSSSNITFNISFVIVDNDAFVIGSEQKENVDLFIDSLTKITSKHHISTHQWQILKASEIFDLEDLKEEWDSRNRTANSMTEIAVDEEFERLQRRTLPAQMKTRNFSREIARKNFLVQLSFGSVLPTIFDNSIVLQSAKAHSQATKIFNLGSKLVGIKPVIISHWKDPEKVK